MILHIVSSSPFADNHLMDCLAITTDNDVLLLLGDGVYALANEKCLEKLAAIKEVYAINDDCLARAITPPQNPLVQPISFEEMTEIVARYPLNQSWF